MQRVNPALVAASMLMATAPARAEPMPAVGEPHRFDPATGAPARRVRKWKQRGGKSKTNHAGLPKTQDLHITKAEEKRERRRQRNLRNV
jgi:hypothetical protein